MSYKLLKIGRSALVAAAVCASAFTPAWADDAKRPMALVVMVDGLRADAVESGEMPNLERLRAGKWRPGYKAAWSVTGQIAPGSKPSSAPNHVSIATGFPPADHGVSANSDLEAGTASSKPTWLKRVMDAKDGATALFVYSWSPDGNIAPNEGVEYMGGTDAANATALATRLAAANAPDATTETSSAPRIPVTSPSVISASVVPSYVLSATATEVTVTAAGVMVRVALPVQSL